MKQYYERIDLGATLYSKYDENTHEYKLDEAYAKLNKELLKGLKDIKEGRTYSLGEVDEMLKKELGI